MVALPEPAPAPACQSKQIELFLVENKKIQSNDRKHNRQLLKFLGLLHVVFIARLAQHDRLEHLGWAVQAEGHQDGGVEDQEDRGGAQCSTCGQ